MWTSCAVSGLGAGVPFRRDGRATDQASRAVCAAVVARFLQAGYERIYLKTDDWRLPAIKVYLQLGFVPFLFTMGMEERWKTVCAKLKWHSFMTTSAAIFGATFP